MSLPEFYECLNCHKIFKKLPSQNGKFCSRECYNETRKKFPQTQLKKLISIPHNEVLSEKNIPVTQSIETPDKVLQNESVEVPAQVCIPVDDFGNGDLVINFNDLTVSEIKDVIKQLLDQVQYLEKIIEKQKESTPLQEVVTEFVQKIIDIQSTPVCPVCEKHFTPTYMEQIFCSDNCATSCLPPSSIIRMNDGRFLWNKKVVV